ncbi:MAG: hypothetical protein MPN21_20810 [Thermoanaerobaculia bacterium]|nr:hypothetical protein [Thermoanaerobaculia bacterium]
MSAAAHLVVLAVLFSALRGRLLWTRLGGLALGLATLAGGVASWSDTEVRSRLADPDLWPAVLFVVVAGLLAWWTMRREQERTRPIHEQEEPESLARLVPLSPLIVGGMSVFLVAALVPAPVGLPPDSAVAPDSALSHARSVPWFLLGLAELSRHLGPLVAWLLIPLAMILALAATPRLDTSQPETEGPFRGRRDEAPFFLWAWLGLGLSPLVVALFGPVPNEAAPGPALAEWFWLDLLARREPDLWLLRELPGVCLGVAVAVVLPWILPRSTFTRGVFGRHLRRLGSRRYIYLCLLLTAFMLVPVGLAMRAIGFGPWLRLAGGWWL